ncbi:hypothetical protein KH5_23850 [Urechidicola sp. KH5]
MNEQQIERLNNYNTERLVKYNLFKVFEKEQIGKDFKACLEDGYSSNNSRLKYMNYLRYYFLPYAFINKISSNDFNLLAVQKNEIGLIYYSIYKSAIYIEEVHPRESSHSFLQSYCCLEQISDNPRRDIQFFLDKGLLKRSQKEFINDILKKFDLHMRGFKGTFTIIREPYFLFKRNSF